jgi:hypothetical protein
MLYSRATGDSPPHEDVSQRVAQRVVFILDHSRERGFLLIFVNNVDFRERLKSVRRHAARGELRFASDQKIRGQDFLRVRGVVV